MSIVPRRGVGIRENLARRLRPVALAIAVLIGLAPPATYYVFERLSLETTAGIYAETFAERLRDVVAENAALWKYSGQKHAQLLDAFLVERDIIDIEIVDEAGRRVGRSEKSRAGRPWWEGFAPAAAAPIRFNNREVGAVRVTISSANLLATTLVFVALFAVVGAGLALFVYRFPARVVGKAETRIEELIARLDGQVKETDALLEIARATDSSRDAPELFGVVAQGALRTCAADFAGVLTLDEPGLRLRMVARAERQEPEGGAPAGGSEATVPVSAVTCVGDAIRRRAPVTLQDTGAGLGLPPEWRVPRDTHAVLAVPLSDRRRIVGVLLLGYRTPGPPAAAGARVASALVDQVALALHNIVLINNLSGTVEELRAKNAELDSFAYSVSHDLRAPLVSLQGLAGMLAERAGERLDEECRHYLDRIVYNGSHMERLLRDVIALSRVGRETDEPEWVDLRGLVDEVLGQLAEPIRARGVVVTVHDLGSVVASRTRLAQVLSNLIGNAVKYLGETPAPTVEIGGCVHDRFVECWIRDTGIGIDPAYHETIFRPFQRLQDVDVPGSGLGLAIVRKIVEGVGGRVWVESAAHQGATFHFTWPAWPARSAASAA